MAHTNRIGVYVVHDFREPVFGFAVQENSHAKVAV
jgi:hypothetical protein